MATDKAREPSSGGVQEQGKGTSGFPGNLGEPYVYPPNKPGRLNRYTKGQAPTRRSNRRRIYRKGRHKRDDEADEADVKENETTVKDVEAVLARA